MRKWIFVAEGEGVLVGDDARRRDGVDCFDGA